MAKNSIWVVRSALLAGIAFAAPATAHAGFLEELFGAAPPAPAPQAPAYDYDRPVPDYRFTAPARPKRKLVANDKPKLQKPTDLMKDPTLQSGDAVMTKTGLKIYTGDDGVTNHSKSDFDAIDDLEGVPKTERLALLALDTTRNDPLRRASFQPDTVASGRSAASGVPISPGHPIVDARGRTVRYVGP